jgi:hypothetical protein
MVIHLEEPKVQCFKEEEFEANLGIGEDPVMYIITVSSDFPLLLESMFVLVLRDFGLRSLSFTMLEMSLRGMLHQLIRGQCI